MLRSRTRNSALLILTIAALGGACTSDATGEPGPGAGGKADSAAESAFLIVGDDARTRLSELPVEAAESEPLRRSDADAATVSALYDATFGTDVTGWLEDADLDLDALRRASLFAAANERDVRDDFATFNGVEWSADELRTAYALAYLSASEDDRIVLGDGVEPIDAGAFHVVVTQLLADDVTVIRGASDFAGAVYTGMAVKARANHPDPTGPREISRDEAEDLLFDQDVERADHYYYVFASITTTTGFASESYVIATDDADEVLRGYWVPAQSALPNLVPTRLWIGNGRPEAAAGLSFAQLDELAAAFNETVPGPTGDTWEYAGEPVPFTENRFFCAKVEMDLPERFLVGDIVVRATFSPVDGDRWDRELEISLAHAPAGSGPSIARITGNESE
ncbi:MAG: hypothetical protein AAF645_14265, partial [Myxococcota bacterium]